MQRPDLAEQPLTRVSVAGVVDKYDRDWYSPRVRSLDGAYGLLSRRLSADAEVTAERPLQFGLDDVELHRVRIDRQ
jgi:hypothetical protein